MCDLWRKLPVGNATLQAVVTAKRSAPCWVEVVVVGANLEDVWREAMQGTVVNFTNKWGIYQYPSAALRPDLNITRQKRLKTSTGSMSYTPQPHAMSGHYSSTPPPPPPKQSTPSRGPPLPPTPGQQNEPSELDGGQSYHGQQRASLQPSIPAIESNWLPENVKDKS